jgi:branched-chain amino acid transport system ATP-binding protein
MSPILEVVGLFKSFGGLKAVNDMCLTLPGKELHAIIGPNGAGKTTLFNLISGFIKPDRGSIGFWGKNITGVPTHKISRQGIARTLQVKSVFNGLTVYENIWIAAQTRGGFLHPLRPASSYKKTAARVEALLLLTGLESHTSEAAGNLSYGDVSLLEIAIALATEPKLLLLDEPVAGMSPEETERTARTIKELSKTIDIVLIEHDMEVVFGIADTVTVMNQGAMLCQGRPEDIACDQRVQEAYLGPPDEEECDA